MKRIYIVPNLVTTGNLFCGFWSITAAIRYDFQTAAWAILLAMVFDLLDGRIARLARATSEFGSEYDSLSDLISFGMAPALLMYLWILEGYGRLGMLAAFAFLCCAAFRLARFNVSGEKQPKGFFQGLPTPGAAGIVATFCIYRFKTGYPEEHWLQALSLVFALGLGLLMVSTLLFPSFKEWNWRSRVTFGYLLVVLLSLVLIAVNPEVFLFLLILCYLLASLLWNLLRWVRVIAHSGSKEA